MALMSRYGLTLDCRDADGWAACFTDDGVFEGRLGTVRGRHTLRQYVERKEPDPAPRHISGIPSIDPDPHDPTRATATCAFVYPQTSRDATVVDTAGHYRDALVRVQPGRWLFERRTMVADKAPGR